MVVFALAVLATIALEVGIAALVWGRPDPPPVPLSWMQDRPGYSAITLDVDGKGHVTDLPLATPMGADCASSEVLPYTGDITWRMTGDGEGEIVADRAQVAFRGKWRFGVVDWSTVYTNSCTNDPSLPGWTTYLGGTGP